MRLLLTLLLGKTVIWLSRRLGRGGGSALPGLLAERLTPDIAQRLGSSLPQGVVLVTGTNGKTTTTKMVRSILEAAGMRVLTNRSGSNLSRGVVSSLVEQATLRGRLQADLGLFEVDEAAMPAVARALEPRAILVLNLFRDQLDRYGELDKTASLIGQAIAAGEAHVYLNADDPLVAHLATYAADRDRVHYFGIDAPVSAKLASDLAADSDHCPLCGRALEYSRVFFGHVGHYHCPTGHFERPSPASALAELTEEDERHSVFRVTVDGAAPEGVPVTLQLPGLYNAYNALAALALTAGLGVGPETAAATLAKVDAAFGRVERVVLAGREIYLLLIKNPTGFNQVLRTFLVSRPGRHVLMLINDNIADGRDVSWLWDVGFEDLAPLGHHILAGGIRGTDLALRLKYAGVPSTVEPDVQAALDRLLAEIPPGETGYILPTYTAMLEVRALIGRRSKLKGFWE